jgi:hypothetical protein
LKTFNFIVEGFFYTTLSMYFLIAQQVVLKYNTSYFYERFIAFFKWMFRQIESRWPKVLRHEKTTLDV